jgi:hypothetical protein
LKRVIFATLRDRIYFHADTRETHLPHIDGSEAVIDQALIPGQADLQRNVPRAGVYPVTVRSMPQFVRSALFVLPNRFIDTTDAQGHYRLSDVPVGNVVINAWYPGARPERVVVAIQAGQTATAYFHMHQEPERRAPPAGDSGIPAPQ